MYSSTGTKSTFESIKQPHLGEPAASSDCRLKSRTAWVRPGESAAVREPESAVGACRCARASEIQEVRDGAPPPPTSTPLAALREPCTCIHVCMADKGLSPSIAAAGQWRLVNICAAHLRPGGPSSRLPPRRARRAPRRAWSPARQRWPALGDSDPGPDPWGSFMGEAHGKSRVSRPCTRVAGSGIIIYVRAIARRGAGLEADRALGRHLAGPARAEAQARHARRVLRALERRVLLAGLDHRAWGCREYTAGI